MPFCTAPRAHNPRFWDLINSLDTVGRTHELLARRVQRNVEDRGILYTPIAELEPLGDVTALIATYNSKLYYKHRPARNLVFDNGHVFIQSYEEDTHDIVTKLQTHAASGISGYTAAVEQWLGTTAHTVDDAAKRAALTGLFAQSRVALIYGAAGTGKTRMVDHIANYFADNQKLFLANTHPAVENLRRRVTAPESTFRTIASHKHNPSGEFDLLVIDECSTVSNADLLNILQNTSFKLIVLVGDVFQIESIRFGNWFNVVRSYIEPSSIFELTTPYRTSSDELIDFWTKVRTLDEGITETIARNKYSTDLDASLFDNHSADDIILALNYDGLYGINNINRFLQAGNTSPAVPWGPASYKVGDPVLFADLPKRFSNTRPVLTTLIRRVLKGSERRGPRSRTPERHDSRGVVAKNPAKSQTRLTPGRRAELVADYEAGMPVRMIAAKYAVHRGTVPALVTKEGARLRTSGLSLAGRARAASLYAEGLTLREVAERLGVDEKTVRNAVVEESGLIRPRGRRPHEARRASSA